jgi:hypothetical protein
MKGVVIGDFYGVFYEVSVLETPYARDVGFGTPATRSRLKKFNSCLVIKTNCRRPASS